MNLEMWLRSQMPLFNHQGIHSLWGNPTHTFTLPSCPTFLRQVYRVTDRMGGKVTTSGYVQWTRMRIGARIRTTLDAMRLYPESDHGLRQWGFQGSAGTLRVHLRHYRQYNLTVARLIAQGYDLRAADREAFSRMDRQARQLLVQQITLLAISVLSSTAPTGPIAGAASAPGNALQFGHTIANPPATSP